MDIRLSRPQTHIAHVMCGSEHGTRQRDATMTQLSQNGHFTFLEEHSRYSSVCGEIVESYSCTAPRSHQENFSTVRNVSSQPTLRREEWSTATGAQSRNRPTHLRPPPRNGAFFDAFRDQKDMSHLKPPPLSVSRPVETTTRRQGRPRSSSVPLLMPRQTPSLTLFPRIDPAPTLTPALIPKPSYPGSEISSSSPYPASSTAVSLCSVRQLIRPPVPPKDSPLRPFQPPVVPRKDTPSLPPLKIPSSQNPSTVHVSMRNPIKGPALYTQPRPCPLPAPAPIATPTSTPKPNPTPCRHQHHAMRLNTPYMQMLLALDKIPRLHNILVSCFTWLLLVAFIIVTGSFSHTPSETILRPLFITSLTCTLLALFGCIWLGIRWRRNYVWLINRLYMPLFLNGLAGMLATLASVYAQHAGKWCLQAVVAAAVEGVVVSVATALFGVYNFVLLRRVRKFESGYYGKGTKVWVVGQEDGEGKGKKGRGWGKRPHAPGSIV